MWTSWIRSFDFLCKEGFKIIGIDNNTRKFFGKDGDISWVREKLSKKLKKYFHYNIDIETIIL